MYINLYLKSEVHLCLYLMYLKWGTSEVHKRGLTRFLDDLGIMHLMYVYIHEKSEIKTHNMLILNFDLWWPLMTLSDLKWPQKVSYTQSQYESIILTSRGFQKHISCLGSVIFEVWPLMTSHDLKWPRILKTITDS